MKKSKTTPYDKVIYNLVRFTNNTDLKGIFPQNEIYQELKDTLLLNIKKSTFLGNILPSILFLLISLISFSLTILSYTNSNLGLKLKASNLMVVFIMFGVIFLILSLVLFIRRVVLKLRVITLNTGYKKGYNQISKEKYLKIINKIDENLE